MHSKAPSGTGTDGPGGNITVMTDVAMIIDLDESADIKLNGFCTRTRLNKKLLRLIAAHKSPESEQNPIYQPPGSSYSTQRARLSSVLSLHLADCSADSDGDPHWCSAGSKSFFPAFYLRLQVINQIRLILLSQLCTALHEIHFPSLVMGLCSHWGGINRQLFSSQEAPVDIWRAGGGFWNKGARIGFFFFFLKRQDVLTEASSWERSANDPSLSQSGKHAKHIIHVSADQTATCHWRCLSTCRSSVWQQRCSTHSRQWFVNHNPIWILNYSVGWELMRLQ